jgi:hypothetical protein
MRNLPTLSLSIPLAAGLFACGAEEGNPALYTDSSQASASNSETSGTEGGSGDDDGGTTPSGDDTSGASASETASDSGSDDGPKLDVGGETATAEGGEEDGCRGVDFLFVIDNSGSMEDEQSNLLASFPGFIQSMQGLLDESAQSFRVMVTDTDGIGTMCDPICDMFPTGYCNGISCAGDPCEIRIGGGNNTNQSTQASCNLPGGKRYADSDEINISEAFNCSARVGTTGSGVELVADSLLTALSPSHLGAGGCNDGFLRDDAVLVVTIITDEDDAGNDPYMTSPGDPSGWYNDLSAVKDYDPNALVVLGLLGDTDDPDGLCEPYSEGSGEGAEHATRLREFVGHFGDKGLTGSVCAPSYATFFEEAVALIDTTCDDFIPPG